MEKRQIIENCVEAIKKEFNNNQYSTSIFHKWKRNRGFGFSFTNVKNDVVLMFSIGLKSKSPIFKVGENGKFDRVNDEGTGLRLRLEGFTDNSAYPTIWWYDIEGSEDYDKIPQSLVESIYEFIGR